MPASLIALCFGNFIIGAGMLVVPGMLLALWQKHFSPIWSRTGIDNAKFGSKHIAAELLMMGPPTIDDGSTHQGWNSWLPISVE